MNVQKPKKKTKTLHVLTQILNSSKWQTQKKKVLPDRPKQLKEGRRKGTIRSIRRYRSSTTQPRSVDERNQNNISGFQPAVVKAKSLSTSTKAKITHFPGNSGVLSFPLFPVWAQQKLDERSISKWRKGKKKKNYSRQKTSTL